MSILKTTLIAGCAAAALAATVTSAGAAERITIREHGNRVVATERFAHRAPVRVVTRAPVAVWGGWYADPGLYHPYAYYRLHASASACFAVTQHGFEGNRHAMIGATLCYGHNGAPFVIKRHVVRFL